MSDRAEVSVVILNWNRKEMLLDCLRSIKELDYLIYKIIVVDNASTDGSVQAVREACPDVALIEDDKNYGAIGGKNIGLRRALQSDVEYIYMQDNDIVAAKNSLNKLNEVAEADPNMGMVGTMITITASLILFFRQAAPSTGRRMCPVAEAITRKMWHSSTRSNLWIISEERHCWLGKEC